MNLKTGTKNYLFNQFRHQRCRRRLDMEGQTSLSPRNKYFSEIFSPSHIKLTNDNPYKDVKSVKRPLEVEKFKLDRQIFSG